MALTTASIPTIKYEGKDWAGLTSANNLGNLFGEHPEEIGGFIDTLYKVNLQDDIINYINKYPTLELNDDVEYQWKIMGADNKNIPLIKATDLAGNALTAASTAGKYGARFKLVFGEMYFFQTHVIVGEQPDLYQLLIRTEPVQVEGGNWEYEVELVTSDPELYVPYDELTADTRWSIEYSLSEQFMSKTGSDISFTSPFIMSNRISMLRKKTTVPGEMIRKGMNTPMTMNWQVVNKDGKAVKMKTWINRLDFEFDKQFRKEKAQLMFYGKANQRSKQGNGTFANIGDAGGPIKAGMGLREQISAANTNYYTTFSIEQFVSFLLGMSVGRIPEKDRHFVVGTGEYGLQMVSQAIERYAGAEALSYQNQNNRMDTISKDGGNKWSYTKPQFVKHANINGISFEFVLIPWYDDPVRNKRMHPDGGTIESRRLTIMDFGTSSGQPNIQAVRLKGQPEVFGYIPGLRDPFSPTGKAKAMNTGVDGYEIHRADWVGCRIADPTRCGEYILNM